jgi:hypothetical protein
MGLKYFHFVFIGLAIGCTLAFGLWALFTQQEVVEGWGRLGGVVSTLIGLGLMAYLRCFSRKAKGIVSGR